MSQINYHRLPALFLLTLTLLFSYNEKTQASWLSNCAQALTSASADKIAQTNLNREHYQVLHRYFKEMPSSAIKVESLRTHLNLRDTSKAISAGHKTIISGLNQVTATIAFIDSLFTNEAPATAALTQLGKVKFKVKYHPTASGWQITQSGGTVKVILGRIETTKEALELSWNLMNTLYQMRLVYRFLPWKYGHTSLPFCRDQQECLPDEAALMPSAANSSIIDDSTTDDPRPAKTFTWRLNLPKKFAESTLNKIALVEYQIDRIGRALLLIDMNLDIKIPAETTLAKQLRLKDLNLPFAVTTLTLGAAMDLTIGSLFGNSGYTCTTAAAYLSVFMLFARYSAMDPKCDPTLQQATQFDNAQALQKRHRNYWYTSNLIRSFVFATALGFATQIPQMYESVQNLSDYVKQTMQFFENAKDIEIERVLPTESDVNNTAKTMQIELTQEIAEIDKLSSPTEDDLRRRKGKTATLQELITHHGDLRN